MGRKIPGKKHRTIKDPYKQRKKRLESIRLKVDNPPSNSDEQPIPKSLLKIIELKEKAKKQIPRKPTPKVKLKKNNKFTLPSVEKVLDKSPTQPGMTKPSKYIPKLSQKPNESANSYIRRLDLMTQELINEVEFEKKFGVEIQKNPKTGQVIEVKKIKKHTKSKKKKLSEKRKDKFLTKKESLKNIKDFNQLKDKVEFGEVVHRPPTLVALKKSTKTNQIGDKQRYGSLLLNNLKDNKQDKLTSKVSDLQKEKAENERRFIVEAYRKAKKAKDSG